MSNKSFKDIYAEDRTKVSSGTVTVPKVENIPPMPEVKPPREATPVVETFSKEDGKAILEEVKTQREESEKLVETLVKSNKKMSVTVAKLVESANETNGKLLEAITALTEKVAMLEGKLDEIKHLEIPTPIVNLQMPGKKVLKKVNRDAKGQITSIEESEVFSNDEDDSAFKDK
jgi:hypothetical protein